MTVVCVDDEEDHAELLRRALDGVPGVDVKFVSAPSVDLAVETLRQQPVDFLFLDYRLGASNGADVLRSLRAARFSKPVVMLTAHGNEYVAATAVRAGADEYLAKADIGPEALALVMERAETHARQRMEAERALDRASKLEEMSRTLADAALFWSERARHDSLTGLLSRTAWEDAAAQEVERALRFGHSLCLCLVDVDGFKTVNDVAGHLAGDSCLQEVARAVANSCRTVDSVGRFGGDEFVLMLPETGLVGGLALAERARVAVIERDVKPPGRDWTSRVTISVGVAAGLPGRWQDLVAEADRALYEAKRLGRNRVEGRELTPG